MSRRVDPRTRSLCLVRSISSVNETGEGGGRGKGLSGVLERKWRGVVSMTLEKEPKLREECSKVESSSDSAMMIRSEGFGFSSFGRRIEGRSGDLGGNGGDAGGSGGDGNESVIAELESS